MDETCSVKYDTDGHHGKPMHYCMMFTTIKQKSF